MLLGYAVVLHALSARLARDPSAVGSVRTYLALASILAGAVYLASLHRLRARPGRSFLAWTVVSALLARGIVGLAPPLLENDFYRYLWDGAVTAQGINPYRHPPSAILAGTETGADADRLRALAREAGAVLPSINHPELTTIYPPLAQALFALAYTLDPFGLGGWRAVLLVCDALTVLLLVQWFRLLSLPLSGIAWYASNPLLLREVYSALHMDVLVLPFVVGAGLLVGLNRVRMGAVACALGALVKVWPVLLLAHVLRGLTRVRAVATLTVLAICALPILFLVRDSIPGAEATSGFVAYGQSWQNNDGFFRAGIWLTERVLGWISIEPWHSHAVMRVLCTTLLLALLLWRARSSRTSPLDAAGEFLRIVALVFLLSPTQFPWYWLWLLPLLALRPFFPLLLYVALLPLYHLQDLGVWVYWVEHLPVWGLLALAALAAWRSRGSPSRQSEVAHA